MKEMRIVRTISLAAAVGWCACACAEDVKWVDGKDLPIEGRAFDDAENYYDRLPRNVSTNVNRDVHTLLHHTAGLQFRFATDSKTLRFGWAPTTPNTGRTTTARRS